MILSKFTVAISVELGLTDDEVLSSIQEHHQGNFRLRYTGLLHSTNQKEYRLVFDCEEDYTMFLLRYA